MALTSRNVLLTIPARVGSKRLARKNFQDLNGKPLWYYSVKEALKSQVTEHVYLLSDDALACAQAREIGAKALELPEQMAGDLTGVVKASLFAVDFLAKHEGLEFEDLIVCQASSPLRIAKDIIETYSLFLAKNAVTAVTVGPVDPHYFHWAGAVDLQDGFWKMHFGDTFLKARQELPAITYPTGSVKIGTIQFLRKNHHFFSDKTVSYLTPLQRSVHVATQVDLELVRALYALKGEDL